VGAAARSPFELKEGTTLHPRPQLTRAAWWPLDGAWDFALDRDALWRHEDEVQWDSRITVPFAPETPASGISATGFFSACWYRRTFARPPLREGERLLLHFGAVDYRARVWLNGVEVVAHEGGYTPFACDVTRALVDGEQTIVVRAEDDPHDLAKPRGKQDWLVEPHSIWYPRTSGIWQTVWLEPVPATRIGSVRWTPSLEYWGIGMLAMLEGPLRAGLRLRVRLSVDGETLSDDTYSVTGGEVNRRIAPSDPGVDDYRNELLWSPANPRLIDAELELWGGRGDKLDEVRSYTALRSVAVQGDRFLLNGRVQQLRMVLDQGYWPETGMTPPDADALRRDVELAKAMGFNGVRKHQKIEDPRYLYWADRLGLMVWEEMPSAYRFTPDSVERLTREWTEVVARDRSHPCIVAWVPFNESWGVPDLPAIAAQRHYVQALYHLTHTLDASRPVIGNDGWESTATDIIGIHDYDDDLERLARRYERPDVLPELFRHGRPGGRLLTIEGHPHAGQPIMLTEFGGIAVGEAEDATWGYSRCVTPKDFALRYHALLDVVRASELLAGFCYTQFADTYQESNGLLCADRSPKIPFSDIAAATRGTR
jgi:Glycosyl hydrolases family 2, TIM barrel domain/Glycosyl hydrolases family 2, sugar binding domain